MSKVRLALASSALAIAVSACTTPAAQAPMAGMPMAPAMAKVDTVDTQLPTQLPREAVPSHYALTVTPDMANLTFAGQIGIDVEVVKPTTTLTMNAVDMTFRSAKATPLAAGLGAPKMAATTVNAEAQTVTLTFASPLQPGRWKIDLDYSGKINTQANGLFALDYKDVDGKDARSIFTQFEPADARRFFPGWDEPDYKARFDLAAIVPSGLRATSNMPATGEQDLGNGTKKVSFATTPEMSSYLLFFAAGDMGRISQTLADGTEVGVVMSRGNEDKARTALAAQAQLLPYYNDYFGVKYPLPKLDNVAAPGQSQFFSAMENWGAILTFERILLDDPAVTTEAERQAIYGVDAHEMAHQWFGDLVTMGWWDDLWLNEGFASWMATKATEHFHPEWGAGYGLVGAREAAMGQDGLKTTHPVVQTVRTVEQANQAFDGITYSKGQAVISMLEDYAGSDTWRDGIRAYMKAKQYKNSRTDELWQAVETAGAKGLTSIAHQFTLQPGVPLIRVGEARCEGGDTLVALTQDEFSVDRPQGSYTPLKWSVPVKLNAGGQTVTVVTSGATTAARVPGCGPLLVNAGQKGYYRTLYTPAAAAGLASNLSRFGAVDQFGMIGDQAALATAGYQKLGVALDLIAAITPASDPTLIATAANSWQGLYGAVRDNPAAKAKVGAEIQRRFGPVLDRIGLVAKPGEAPTITTLRPALIGLLGAIGSPTIKAEATRLFAALQADPNAVPANLKRTWLAQVAANADVATWERLRAMAKASTNATERQNFYNLLASAQDEALARRTLDLALTDEPGKTISAAIIGQVAARHPELALDFVLAHLKQVTALVDLSSQSRFVARIAQGSNKPETIAKLDAYAKANLKPGDRGAVDQAINIIRVRQARMVGTRAQMLDWLKGRGLA